MTALAGAPVVVGVDGSESSMQAVALATRLAVARGRPLRIVHAFGWAELPVPLGPDPFGPPEGGLANEAKRIVTDAIAAAEKAAPGLAISGDVVDGQPVPVLLEEARRAALVVLGSRGLGGFTGLLLGSVAVQLAAHAPCPVVVARGDIDRERDILVGVSGAPADEKVLQFAFEEAAFRGVGIIALHAYRYPVSGERGDPLPVIYDVDQLETDEAAVLAEALAGWHERYPDVPVHRLLVRDRPSRALIQAADRASLVVVGSRGRGGFAGLLLGSVSHALLHHASCPVAVLR